MLRETTNASRRTQAQERILNALLCYGMMTREQIQRAVGRKKSSVADTLNLLENRKLVSYCRRIDENQANKRTGFVKPFHIYALAPAGMERLGVTEGTCRTWDGTYKTIARYDHDREVVDLLIDLNNALRREGRTDGLKVHVATSKKRVVVDGAKKLISATNIKIEGKQYFLPDAILTKNNPSLDRGVTTFLEYERNSDPKKVLKRCREKLINYATALKNGNHDFINDQYVLLYVVSKTSRVTEILTSSDAVPLYGILRVAHFDDVIANPLGQIWKRADNSDGKLVLRDWGLVHG